MVARIIAAVVVGPGKSDRRGDEVAGSGIVAAMTGDGVLLGVETILNIGTTVFATVGTSGNDGAIVLVPVAIGVPNGIGVLVNLETGLEDGIGVLVARGAAVAGGTGAVVPVSAGPWRDRRGVLDTIGVVDALDVVVPVALAPAALRSAALYTVKAIVQITTMPSTATGAIQRFTLRNTYSRARV
jgi:hypothetical protein